MNIFDFPMKDFNYLLANVGKQIAINGTATKALIGHNTKPNLTADYRYISTLQQTHRGDLIKWDNANWLVLSEVAQKVYSYYYKAEIRKCNFSIKMIIGDIVQTFPAIIDSKVVDIDTGQYFNLPEGKIIAIIPDTATIPIDKRFLEMGKAFKVTGTDLTKTGLCILHCDLDVITADDDVENEVADGKTLLYVLTITNGDTASIQKDGTLQLAVNLAYNGNPSDKSIAYSTSNAGVATVDATGLVKGINVGECTITAYMVDMPNVSDAIKLTVQEEPQENFTYNIVGADEIYSGSIETYVAHKYNNGVLVEDAQFLFNIDPGDTPTDAYQLTKIDDTSCSVKANDYGWYVTLNATDKDNVQNYTSKEIHLRSFL